MILAKYRIPRTEIIRILKKGVVFNSKLFVVRFTQNDKIFCRYRTIVSKKLEKEAVKRNKLRRKIYEAVRETEKEKTAIHKDIILIPKKQIVKTSFDQLIKDIKTIKHGKIQ